MTQTSTNEKTESLQTTEGTEMLDRFWSDIRSGVDSVNIVCCCCFVYYNKKKSKKIS